MAKKYERIADDLRRRIQANEYRPGDQLPTRDQLGMRYRTSPGPVDEALALLRAEGLVETLHGKGTFVRAARRKVQRTPDRYQWEKDRVSLSEDARRKTGAVEKDTGLEFDHLDFHAEYKIEPADGHIGDVLGVPAGAKILHRFYRTRARSEDAPVSLINSYLVYDMISANPDLLNADNEPWPGGTLHQLATVGIEVDRIIDRINTRPPNQEEAYELGIGPGVAVFVLQKTSVDTDGRIVEVSEVVMPGDRTEFVYTTQLNGWDSK